MVEAGTRTTEDKGRFLLELYRKALTLPEKELYEYFLDHAVQATKSKIGFFHRVTDDQKIIKLTTWNKEALKTCTANYENHYPIEKAGNWADCVRVKRPVIYNKFALSPNQKGLPEGHTEIKRILSIPIIEDDNVQVIFGVGNKTNPYNQEDVVQLDLVANELNKIMKQRKAERELRESKEKYHSLFANMTEGFFLGKILVDNEGKPSDFVFLEVNNGFEKQSGLRAIEVVGKTAKQSLSDIEQSWIETYGKVALTGKPVRFENYNQNTKRWYEVYAYCPVKGQFAAIFTDVTKRKEVEAALRESEIKFRTAANFTYDWEYWIAPDGNLVYMSPSCKKATGYTSEEFVKDPELLTKIVPAEDKSFFNSHFELTSKDGSHKIDFRILTKEGELRWVSHVCQPVFDDKGKFIGRRVSNRDITERRKMLSQLENYSHNLEKIVEERTMELRVKEHMAAIGQTAAMVGHDLRNPLQSVTAEVYLVKKELEMLPESEQKHNLKESIELIDQQASYMDKIVTDLQSFEKPIEVSKQSVNLKHMIFTILSQIQIPANITTSVNVEDILKADADPQLLQRALVNLLTNAVQAMHEGGKLAVSAQTNAQGGVSISISDTGPGIPKEIGTKIFTPLFTTKPKGQGLGLASCKRIVEAQGGSISFRSEMGKGTKFTIHLPQNSSALSSAF